MQEQLTLSAHHAPSPPWNSASTPILEGLPARLLASLADTRASLACPHDISRRGWLLDIHLGGSLLKLRAEPRARDARLSPGEWQMPEGYEGPVEYEQCGRGANLRRIPHPGWFGPHKRGRIHGFSMQSRMRLLYKINALDAEEAGVLCSRAKFITLTYPRELLPSWEWAKRQLDAFLHALFRRTGRRALLWRMEYQEDGALHFHLILFYAPFLPWQWVAATWDRLIGNQVEPEDSASTEIHALRSWRQTKYYVSKYIAKESEEAYWDLEHGRHWGARNWDMLPVHRAPIALSAAEGFAVRRWLRRLRLAKGIKTRHLGRSLPFCHQSEAGLTLFDGSTTAVRMIRCLRGQTLEFDARADVTFVTARASPARSIVAQTAPKEGENNHGTAEQKKQEGTATPRRLGVGGMHRLPREGRRADGFVARQ